MYFLGLLKEGWGLKEVVQHVMVSENEVKLKNFKSKFHLGHHLKTCVCSYLSFRFILTRAVTLGSGLLAASKLSRILVCGRGTSCTCDIGRSSTSRREHCAHTQKRCHRCPHTLVINTSPISKHAAPKTEMRRTFLVFNKCRLTDAGTFYQWIKMISSCILSSKALTAPASPSRLL